MEYTLTPKVKAITENAPDKVTGYYVYLWKDRDEVFYVGLGKGRRAWNSHNADLDRYRQFCGVNFSVTIIRDGLTKVEAKVLKAKYKEQYRV